MGRKGGQGSRDASTTGESSGRGRGRGRGYQSVGRGGGQQRDERTQQSGDRNQQGEGSNQQGRGRYQQGRGRSNHGGERYHQGGVRSHQGEERYQQGDEEISHHSGGRYQQGRGRSNHGGERSHQGEGRYQQGDEEICHQGGERYQQGEGSSHQGGATSRQPNSRGGMGQKFGHPHATKDKQASRDVDKHQSHEPKHQSQGVIEKKETAVVVSEISSRGIPKRREPGSYGALIVVEVNFFAMKFESPNMIMKHYDVDIKPDRPFRMYRKVVNTFKERNFPGIDFAYDGRKNIYSNNLLDPKKLTDTFNVRDEDKSDDHRGFEYTKTLTLVNDSITCKEIFNYMQSGSSLNPPQLALQAIETSLKHPPYLNKRFIGVGRSFFSPPTNKVFLGNGLVLWNGFSQSVILGWKPFLNVDVAHKGFPEAVNCIKALENIIRSYRNTANWSAEDFAAQSSSRDHQFQRDCNNIYQNFKKYMKGLKVVYQLPGDHSSKRKWNITDLAEAPRFNKFNDGDKMTTVEEYYAKKKHYKLRYPLLPCLQAGQKTTRNICLPLELCQIAEGQILNKKLDAFQTSKMVRAAATSTDERKDKIMKAVNEMDYNNDPYLKQLGISINSNFEKVPARILPAPDIKYKDKKVKVDKGVWRTDVFFSSIKLERWAILNLDDRIYPNTLKKLSDKMISIGANLGLRVETPIIVEKVSKNRTFELNKLLCELIKLQKEFDNNIQIVVVIIQNNQYGIVKEAAELHSVILTQCIKSETARDKLSDSTVSNILLKVNAKLNGINHITDLEKIRNSLKSFNFLTEPVIVMGADVTHPSPDQTEIPSIAAVTGSYDVNAFIYDSKWSLQESKLEIIKDLKNMVQSLLLNFYRKNKQAKPKEIIFYRDGVSEGQFRQVRNEEIQAIRQACKAIENDYEPPITFIVVQKRHNTRLFPTSKDALGKNKNVPPGTVVDQIITHPTEKQFYLNSHASIQGTSRPTKYHVLWDDKDRSMDDLQMMTYNLCHLFTRCTRAVSLPAPTYYAHLACYRNRAYFDGGNMKISDFIRNSQLKENQQQVSATFPMFYV